MTGTILVLSAIGLVAQDLGSSNKLFGADKKPATTAAVKKNKPSGKTRKPKAVAAHSAKTTRRTTTSAKVPVRIAPRTTRQAPPKTARVALPSASGANSKYAAYIAEGNSARQSGDAAVAETAYKRALALKPNDPLAFELLGDLYFAAMRYEPAEKMYRAALAVDPRNLAVTLALSRVLVQPVAAENLSERYDEAEQLARKSVDMSSGEARSLDQLGSILERRGLLGNETETAYRGAIKQNAGYAPAHAHLGRLMNRNGKAGTAKTEYGIAVSGANDSAALTLVAEAFQSERRYADSIPLLRRALTVEPRNYSALIMLGRALMAEGDMAGAETNLIVATRVSPLSFGGFGELGKLYTRQAKLEMAETVLTHGSSLADSFERRELAAQFELLGDAYDKAGRSKMAENAYRKSLSLDGKRGTLAAKIAAVKR